MSAPPSAASIDAARREGLPTGSRLHSARLANGLWILAAQVPEARQLRLVGAVGAGYLDEPATCRGLAHLLEHSLFLGSEGFPGESELSGWVGRLGGRYNARTDETTTDIHLHLPPDAAEEGLVRLIDLLSRPLLAPHHIAREVDVLDAEFHARRADPALHRLAALGLLCRPTHPARACHAGNRTTLGDDTERLTQQLRDFHRCHYRPERMALVMLGPQPLEAQLTLLERHGKAFAAHRAVPMTGDARSWRWNAPDGVMWCLPDTVTDSHASVLELLWPLPEGMDEIHMTGLSTLRARLADGALAVALQRATDLADLSVGTIAPGAGNALTLRLELVAPDPPLEVLLACCRQALDAALVEPFDTPWPEPADFDAWTRRWARRLASGGMSIATTPGDMPFDALTPRLTADQCRLLWQRPPDATPCWNVLEETGTRFRQLPLPAMASPRDLPGLGAPTFPPRPSRRHGGSARPGRLLQEKRLSLWWGGLDWPGSAGEASWCLGWPAAASDQTARLVRWRQRSLALRQAAWAHGMTLRTEGDSRGDWLMASGEATRLVPLVEQALDAWRAAHGEAAQVPPSAATGLVAQRMLDRLEARPPPGGARGAGDSRLLCWASGDIDACDARDHAREFSSHPALGEFLAAAVSPDRPASGGTTWLPPQGEDQAVMLEVMGGDDSSRSRWLMQLLAQCHDAAFHHEMRQHRRFGYVAAVRYRESAGWPRLGYVVQSPGAPPDALRQAILDFIMTRGKELARLDPAELARHRRGLASRQGSPETRPEAIARAWQALRRRPTIETPGATWRLAPWEEEAQSLASLGTEDLARLAESLVAGELPCHWWLHAPR
ncbi:insulinase family protein [Billgrantia endophytica]|uniref:Uncharacterized protein n=1 Tax=Billgrantia endophytica TaxID=2033802 RepID=A0A2N7U675_9GAMM|nr:insulinase family protein [Halomonas endophytica]PMR75921.1 hypothetical protein C1H69_08240 [Halomonas endophytica]